MAEVDGILIQSLRDLGCEIGEDVLSVREFNTDMLVESVALCLRTISPQIDVPARLSASMATRYRQASVLAGACKAVGYSGEFGYEAFLYGGENEMRKLLLFLLDKLPKEDRAIIGVIPYGQVFVRDISQVVAQEMQQSWLPPAFWPWQSNSTRQHSTEASVSSTPFRSQRISVPSSSPFSSTVLSEEVKDADSKIPVVTKQVTSSRDLLASLIEFNSLKLANASSRLSAASSNVELKHKLSRILTASNLSSGSNTSGSDASKSTKPTPGKKPPLPPRKSRQTASSDSGAGGDLSSETVLSSSTNEKVVEMTEEERVANLKAQVEETSKNILTISAEIETIMQAVNKAEAGIKQGADFLKSLETTTKVKQQVARASGSGASALITVDHIQKNVEELNDTLRDLGEQWETAKAQLNTEVAQLRQASFANENSVERLKEEIRQSKQTVSELQAELGGRDEFVQILRKEYQRTMDKTLHSTSRTAYTKRILEILANIKKQRVEIDKIIRDTRVLQKDMNQLSGRLDRAFTETDELMFRDAKNDEFVRKAYKHVANFHEACAGLIATVETTGAIMRETKDLEDEVETETKKDKESNVQRIMEDLKLIKEENMTLSARLPVQPTGTRVAKTQQR